jgi:hypothetical protein
MTHAMAGGMAAVPDVMLETGATVVGGIIAQAIAVGGVADHETIAGGVGMATIDGVTITGGGTATSTIAGATTLAGARAIIVGGIINNIRTAAETNLIGTWVQPGD